MAPNHSYLAALEHQTTPDATAEIKVSDIYKYERMRVITDAHSFIAPVIFFLGAVFLWLSLRLLFARSAGRIRRLIGLWFAAKEHELSARAGKQKPSP
jgi:hypothetical protein